MSIITKDQFVPFKSSIYNYFCSHVSDISFLTIDNIYLCNDISSDIKNFGYTTTNFQGKACTLFPNEIIESMIVLLEVSSDDNYSNINALFHELVHVDDYKVFANRFCGGTVEDICFDEKYKAYHLWSEFHASMFSEINSLNYCDYILNVQSIPDYLEHQEEGLSVYIEHCHQKIQDGMWGLYDLFLLFGKFGGFDYLHHLQSTEFSCIHQYINDLFASCDRSKILKTYDVCYSGIKEHRILDNLDSLLDLI